METSAPHREPQTPKETGKHALKVNKTCVPCRARKIKCDAAVTGLPCSSCASRECAERCVLPNRKGRKRKVSQVSLTHGNMTDVSTRCQLPKQPNQSSASELVDGPSTGQTEPDLFYLNILNKAVEDTTASCIRRTRPSQSQSSSLDNAPTPRNCLWAELPQLDDLDNEYLVKKGVFDLPSRHLLDALIKTYFVHVHPFSPSINRADFIRAYQSGDCSLFLLWVILTLASVQAPIDAIHACGFVDRSAAQNSFFSKAKLLHDFAAEEDPLLMLQGSIMLCSVVLDHPTEWNFTYWFHNAVRLATKLNVRNTCIRGDESPKVLELYRRIWWSLYSLDIFHVFVNTGRSRLIEDPPTIKSRTEDDLGDEDPLEASSGLLSLVTPQQRASSLVNHELSLICVQCLHNVKSNSKQDVRDLLDPLDAWRKSLTSKIHVYDNTGPHIYYLNAQALSYRYECILCRLIQRQWQQCETAEWVKQRLRSSILELDTIAMRVFANDNLHDFPMAFVTTMAAVLALHIEAALDTTETEVARSMARISISQMMLVLTQGRDIPVLKRALPIFEEIITRKNLGLMPSATDLDQSATQLQSGRENSTRQTDAPSHLQDGEAPTQLEQCGDDLSLNVNFLGFDFLDEWQIGDPAFPLIGRH